MKASLKKEQIEKTRKYGKRIQTILFTAYTLEEKERFGIAAIVSKKIGKSVVRNRIKRRLREAYKELYTVLRPPIESRDFDGQAEGKNKMKGKIVIIYAKNAIIKAKYADIVNSLEVALG